MSFLERLQNWRERRHREGEDREHAWYLQAALLLPILAAAAAFALTLLL